MLRRQHAGMGESAIKELRELLEFGSWSSLASTTLLFGFI